MNVAALVSVCVNVLAAIVLPIVGKKLAEKKEKLDKTETVLDQVSAGIRVIEKAVDDNKDLLNRTGAGDKITNTIRSYGVAAKQLVDAARSVASEVRRAGDPGVDDDVSKIAPSVAKDSQ